LSRTRLLLVAAWGALCLSSEPVHAQSSVTLYGVLDIGVYRNNNVNGSSISRAETRHEPSYFGLRGSEDLGGGLNATYRLEASVAVDTGTSTMWRQSIVGLESRQWGGFTLGRQYDTIIDLVGVDPPRFNSITAVHTGNWDRSAGVFVNNSIKYRTPTFGGLTGSLMYIFKEDGTSATNSGKGLGASATYQQGRLRVTAAWLKLDGVTHRPANDVGLANLFGLAFPATTSAIVTNDTIAGLGAYYDFARWRVLGQYTTTKLSAGTGSERINTLSAGISAVPQGEGLRPSVGVNHSRLGDARWTTAYGILDYFLSKRTDVYVRVISQWAGGAAAPRAALYLEGPSSSSRQTVVGVGVTHRF